MTGCVCRGRALRTMFKAGPFQPSTATRLLDIINLLDLDEEARKLIPTPQFGYVTRGSGDVWTLRENVRAFDNLQIRPRHHAAESKEGTPNLIPPRVPPMSVQFSHTDVRRFRPYPR